MSESKREQESHPEMPAIPSGEWVRWDGVPVVVIALANDPGTAVWRVVYVPRKGRGWEVYSETVLDFLTTMPNGVPKHRAVGHTAALMAKDHQRSRGTKLDKSVSLSSATVQYSVPDDAEHARQVQGNVGIALSRSLMDGLLAMSETVRGNTTLSMMMQVTSDGERIEPKRIVLPGT